MGCYTWEQGERRPILGVQFTTAHRICDVGGLIPIIGFGFDIGNVILYDLEGYKIKSVAAMAGAGLNLFGSGLFAKGSMSSLDRTENWCVWGKLLYR